MLLSGFAALCLLKHCCGSEAMSTCRARGRATELAQEFAAAVSENEMSQALVKVDAPIHLLTRANLSSCTARQELNKLILHNDFALNQLSGGDEILSLKLRLGGQNCICDTLFIVMQREVREAEMLASQGQRMRDEAVQLANTWMAVKHDMEAAKKVGGSPLCM